MGFVPIPLTFSTEKPSTFPSASTSSMTDSSPVEPIVQPDVGIEQRFDHPLWICKSDSNRRFASLHLRVLEDVFEALVCEPHLQSLKVSQKLHGVVRDMLNAEGRARQ